MTGGAVTGQTPDAVAAPGVSLRPSFRSAEKTVNPCPGEETQQDNRRGPSREEAYGSPVLPLQPSLVRSGALSRLRLVAAADPAAAGQWAHRGSAADATAAALRSGRHPQVRQVRSGTPA